MAILFSLFYEAGGVGIVQRRSQPSHEE